MQEKNIDWLPTSDSFLPNMLYMIDPFIPTKPRITDQSGSIIMRHLYIVHFEAVSKFI